MGNSLELNEKRFKKLIGSLECHMTRPHAFLYEISTFIYIYIYWLDIRTILYFPRTIKNELFEKLYPRKKKSGKNRNKP